VGSNPTLSAKLEGHLAVVFCAVAQDKTGVRLLFCGNYDARAAKPIPSLALPLKRRGSTAVALGGETRAEGTMSEALSYWPRVQSRLPVKMPGLHSPAMPKATPTYLTAPRSALNTLARSLSVYSHAASLRSRQRRLPQGE
jgi:hypothetical protein